MRDQSSRAFVVCVDELLLIPFLKFFIWCFIKIAVRIHAPRMADCALPAWMIGRQITAVWPAKASPTLRLYRSALPPTGSFDWQIRWLTVGASQGTKCNGHEK